MTNVDEKRELQAICQSMIELARGLNLEVLAEGVERLEEVQFLTRKGCSLFQGYYFAKPVDAVHLLEIVRKLDRQSAR